MTREDAIAEIKYYMEHDSYADAPSNEACQMAINALRPVSREQVEKVWRGCKECHNQANWPSWIEKGFVYCPKCGTPLASWAWEKQMERLEALHEQTDRQNQTK